MKNWHEDPRVVTTHLRANVTYLPRCTHRDVTRVSVSHPWLGKNDHEPNVKIFRMLSNAFSRFVE